MIAPARCEGMRNRKSQTPSVFDRFATPPPRSSPPPERFRCAGGPSKRRNIFYRTSRVLPPFRSYVNTSLFLERHRLVEMMGQPGRTLSTERWKPKNRSREQQHRRTRVDAGILSVHYQSHEFRPDSLNTMRQRRTTAAAAAAATSTNTRRTNRRHQTRFLLLLTHGPKRNTSRGRCTFIDDFQFRRKTPLGL